MLVSLDLGSLISEAQINCSNLLFVHFNPNVKAGNQRNFCLSDRDGSMYPLLYITEPQYDSKPDTVITVRSNAFMPINKWFSKFVVSE